LRSDILVTKGKTHAVIHVRTFVRVELSWMKVCFLMFTSVMMAINRMEQSVA
jgi:hypothetical protein